MAQPLTPAGAHPLGEPPVAPAEATLPAPPRLLADAIDQATQDFASLFDSGDPVDAAAARALVVHRGTGSAVRSAGSRLHEITLVDDAIQSTVRAEVESAWARMIAAGWLAIDRVDVEASGDSVAVLVRYKNRLSGASRSLRIGAGQ